MVIIIIVIIMRHIHGAVIQLFLTSQGAPVRVESPSMRVPRFRDS